MKDDLILEALEILTNLHDSIAKHGNYSAGSTMCFIDQAGSCLREALGFYENAQNSHHPARDENPATAQENAQNSPNGMNAVSPAKEGSPDAEI